MNQVAATNLITQTFNSAFDEQSFENFVANLLNQVDRSKSFGYRSGNIIPQAFREHISTYHRPFVYYDPDGERLDVLVVRLRKQSGLDRARTMQRNFSAWYLKQDHDEIPEAALIAFYHEAVPDWRFSFVQLEYVFGEEGAEEKLTPARRYSYLVGPTEPTHTAESQLHRFLIEDASNPTITALAAAFQIETVSKQFFEEYKELFLKLVEGIEAVLKKDNLLAADFKRAEIHVPNFAKKLLGQIVFLYFVQKKGWLGVTPGAHWGSGPKDFLRRLFAKAEGVQYGNFFNEVLEPLFYEALAVQRSDDLFTIGVFTCQIPFLNGGLFEPMGGYDWRHTSLLLPNTLFSNRRSTDDDQATGILDVFDRYNFTVWEEEPLEKEVAVDPEMLGKVFENLLEVQDRKSKGAFYTPREIVHYMCQESLINYLDTSVNGEMVAVPREDIAVLVRQGALALQQDAAKEAGLKSGDYVLPPSVRDQAQKLDDALAEIKLCDPAIGSGAFPVGMLHEIVQARQAVGTYLEDWNWKPYQLKRWAIQESIYGVDIDAGAVEIAKLRLWLSLVVDEENYDDIQPLPNLSYKIVCGNSLLGVERNLFNKDLYVKLDELKQRYFEETHQQEKMKLKAQIDQLIGLLVGGKNAFDFKVYFHEVFSDRGGFDVVIANPPYVKEYTNRHAFDGLRSSSYYQGKMDIWYFFGCIGLDILRPHGVECFIAQNNWITSSGASIFREKVIREGRFETFLDFGNYQVFQSASIQTMIYLLLKDATEPKYSLQYGRLNENELTRGKLLQFLYSEDTADYFVKFSSVFDRKAIKGEYITFLPARISDVLEKISKGSITYFLKNEVGTGIDVHQDFVNRKHLETLGKEFKVGDGIFVISPEEKNGLNLLKKEERLIRPYYTAQEMLRYYGNSQNNFWVIYTRSDIDKKLSNYPNIKSHLDQYASVITSDNAPYGLHRAREERLFLGQSIVSLRKCIRPNFTFSDFDCYVSQSFFVIKTPRFELKYLTALLNSKTIEFWLRFKGKMQGDNYQIDKAPLLSIPIKQPPQEILNTMIEVFDAICKLLKTNNFRQETCVDELTYYEEEIDQLVYQLYDLSEKEIAVIEETIKR